MSCKCTKMVEVFRLVDQDDRSSSRFDARVFVGPSLSKRLRRVVEGQALV